MHCAQQRLHDIPENIGVKAIQPILQNITARARLAEKVRPFLGRRRGDLMSPRKV